jgi:hypothetical protein
MTAHQFIDGASEPPGEGLAVLLGLNLVVDECCKGSENE